MGAVVVGKIAAAKLANLNIRSVNSYTEGRTLLLAVHKRTGSWKHPVML